MNSFASLDLVEPIRRAVEACNYTTPTPIQARAIPPLLDGRDVLGCAQTGTGKTAAFALPVLQHLARSAAPVPRGGRRPIRALVLSPTRELAAQIGESFADYGRFLQLRHTVIFGGVSQRPQVAELQRGVDVLVATPGRLLDLKNQGYIDLSQVEFFVLDEADRMLDMGFIHDIRRILPLLPKQRQNLLFSATMPKAIADLAGSFLKDPVRVEVVPQATTAERIEQVVMFVEKSNKRRLLVDLLDDPEIDRALVFTRTKHGANRLVKYLEQDGIAAAAIHGNKSQNAREKALEGFKQGDIRVLVATDVASRGLDIDDITHVFNYELPNEPESYVHRIGRTGRAGREGIAIAFCDETEGDYLRDIEKLIKEKLLVDRSHDWHFDTAERMLPQPAAARPAPGRAQSARPTPRPTQRPGAPTQSRPEGAPPRRRRNRNRRRGPSGGPASR